LTHGVCTGVLTWLIEQGEVEGVDLSGLPVAMAMSHDDEPGSPVDVDALSRRERDRTRLACVDPARANLGG